MSDPLEVLLYILEPAIKEEQGWSVDLAKRLEEKRKEVERIVKGLKEAS